ncbi:MAG: hypothetical protein ISR58_00080 [Anaerolineales bacterium]|nr:hypothetical protein [Chloroflexota bacterium]MBL6979559.1 hypothetical protein [Anaerolineales bacterium]
MNANHSRYANLIAKLAISAMLLILMIGAFFEVSLASDDETSLTIVNASGVDICTVTASILESGDYFENLLDSPLAPGDDFVISGLEPLTADLVAIDCDGGQVNASLETRIEGAFVWEITSIVVEAYQLPDPPPTSPDQTWLVMLYVDADDELLEGSFLLDLNEAEWVGSSDQVHVVAQVDRFEGGFDGDGDWTTAKRFYLTQDSDINVITSDEIQDIGEVNMADPNTLADFVVTSVATYPADKYVLILSDHGSGWFGGWYDQTSPGDWITPLELEAVLGYVQENTSLEQFELIGFDACLMSSLEIYTALAPYARYVVASEEVEPSLGWAYAGFLYDLVENPGMGGVDLAASIVDHYIVDDVIASAVSEEFIENLKVSITLSAFDLAAIPDLLTVFDDLIIAASEIDQRLVARARSYAQSYENTFANLEETFGKNIPPSYLDLGHLAQVLEVEGDSVGIMQASRQLLAILNQAVVAEKHGPQRPGSTGISLYFPNSTLYGAYDLLPGSNIYALLSEHFANQSLWDDFLLYHYTGAPMPEAGAGGIAFAPENTTIAGPGVSQIEIAPISTSSEVISGDNWAHLSTEVTGGQVAWVNLLWGRYDQDSGAIHIMESFPYRADFNHNVNGVVYPDWTLQTEEGVLDLVGDMDSNSLVVTNGTDMAFGTFTTEQYSGNSVLVPGIHMSAATGEERPAVMRFNVDSAEFLNMLVFIVEGGASIPRDYAPQPGDQFTFTLTFVDSETGETQYVVGDTLIFGEQPFWLDATLSPPGQYILGVTVVDLDGNVTQQFIMLTIEE